MEDNRIQNQIAIYMTNKKLCEFTDKLKPAPIEYYAHMHAQGEEQADGIRAYSCIGVVLQDYSNGTGDKTVRVTANLSPGFFPFVLSRMQNDLDRFDFTEDILWKTRVPGFPTASLPTMSSRALRLTMPQARASWQMVLSRRSRRRLR